MANTTAITIKGATGDLYLRSFAILPHNKAHIHKLEHSKHPYANVIYKLYLLLQIHAPVYPSHDDSD